ncbi:hypothetical protein AX16_003872 [Volvariella volvacea WC 439]|nr:hypothetical protein AX16_003872 [Volvariella volvacea WC 439]
MAQRTPVIIDTDPGVDDVLAILLAIASPELDILAYVVSFGNTDVHASQLVAHSLVLLARGITQQPSLNIIKLYHAIHKHLERHSDQASRFPNFGGPRRPTLAKGSDAPLQGELHTAQYFHGRGVAIPLASVYLSKRWCRDGLSEISSRHPDLNVTSEESKDLEDSYLQLVDRPGADVVLDLLREYPPRSITYIALGPLTNLARALRKDPGLVKDKIGRVVCMGGALDIPGNTTPVAEFNFYADPYAVKELVLAPSSGGGLPLSKFTLLPLDITTPHELPFPIYQERVDPAFHSSGRPSIASEKPPLTHFTSAFLERAREVMLKFGKDALELHDIAAVWFAIENPPSRQDLNTGWKVRKRIFDIERTGELTRGMLVVDRREDVSAYAPGTNRAKAQEQLKQDGFESSAYWESVAVPAQVEVEIEGYDDHNPGVSCVYSTPGPEALLELLLKRVWGA